MKDFLLIFRADYASPATAEQMKEAMQRCPNLQIDGGTVEVRHML